MSELTSFFEVFILAVYSGISTNKFSRLQPPFHYICCIPNFINQLYMIEHMMTRLAHTLDAPITLAMPIAKSPTGPQPRL